MPKNKIRNQKGFTLIEILVVIGLIAILATIVLIAINPARQFKQANDTQRVSNVNAILNAIGQYVADKKGTLPTSITGTATEIGAALCGDIVPTYIPSLPTDPNSSSKGASINCSAITLGAVRYEVIKDSNSRITVSAPLTELASPSISVTR